MTVGGRSEASRLSRREDMFSSGKVTTRYRLRASEGTVDIIDYRLRPSVGVLLYRAVMLGSGAQRRVAVSRPNSSKRVY